MKVRVSDGSGWGVFCFLVVILYLGVLGVIEKDRVWIGFDLRSLGWGWGINIVLGIYFIWWIYFKVRGWFLKSRVKGGLRVLFC